MNYRESREITQQKLNEAIETMQTHSRYSKEYACASVLKSRCIKRLKQFDERDKLLDELSACGKVLTRITKHASLGDLLATYAHYLRKIEVMPEGSRHMVLNPEYNKINYHVQALKKKIVKALKERVDVLEARLEALLN